jgi:hypothetical protein
MTKQHIIIFSHGFGTKKDDRGLLSGDHGISETLEKEGIQTVLFDYCLVDEVNNIITVKPLSLQVEILRDKIEEVIKNYPGAVVDIIAHSQGSLVVASLLPKNIRKIILITPSLDANNQRMINLFKNRPRTSINLDGISKLDREDGILTIVPSAYWVERENTLPIPLYNELSKITDLTIIKANQDNIQGNLSIEGLSDNIKLIFLDGDHQFGGIFRDSLIKVIKEIIC